MRDCRIGKPIADHADSSSFQIMQKLHANTRTELAVLVLGRKPAP